MVAVGTSYADSGFVWPGNGVDADTPIWGHKDGIQIALAPMPGPQGLIRIYAPYLGAPQGRPVNFLSIEPSAKGQKGRDQSELQQSRVRPGEQGLSFYASNRLDSFPSDGRPVTGVCDPQQGTLSLFIHTEPFRNGTRSVVEIVFDRKDRQSFEVITHAAAGSAPMSFCTISATMGNYGLLRRLHLKDSIQEAGKLWDGAETQGMGFFKWKTWGADHFKRLPNGNPCVSLTSNFTDASEAKYDSSVRKNWRYFATMATHYWCTEADANPVVAVNARRTYWMTESPIPGGAAFENFELRMPFKEGRRMWFGITPTEAE
jgi:hypothetical protein